MAYASLDEFVRRLGLTNPTAAALDQAQGCLDAATQEIDEYLGWQDPDNPPPAPSADQLRLLVIVNLDRAGEHWRYAPYGQLQQGPDFPTVFAARDSFYRHARKLASLKTSWGIA